MSNLAVPANQPTIPVLTSFVNSASPPLVNLFFTTVLPYPITGAALGYFFEKPITFALCSSMQALIWQYFTPYTVDLLFDNNHSNFSSKLIGATLTYSTGILGSYYLTKYLTPKIAQRFPSVEQLAEENKKPLLKRYVICLSFATWAPCAIVTTLKVILAISIALTAPKKTS